MELFFLLMLVASMAFALGSGYPVAFALPGSAILTIGAAALCGWLFAGDTDAFFAQGGPRDWLSAGVTNLRGVYWEVERDTLIAIPLFIFMGIMLQRSKIAEDLLVTMAQLFGSLPGGLGISVVFVGALLAATTGIVGATVVAMGLISLPAMMRNNYSPALATGTISASGTLGQIIPPSIVLIILADQLSSAVDQASTARKLLYKDSTGELSMPSIYDVSSTSAGEMFLGAFVPGLLLVALYMLYILIYAYLRPSKAPSVPYHGSYDKNFWGKVFVTLVPPLALIFLVLGSIVGGIATVNQAGAIGAAGALIMAGYRLRDGERGAYTPAIIAILALLAIAVITGFFDTNIRKVTTTSDALGVGLAVVAVLLLLFALFWSGWRTYTFEDTLRGVMIETAKTTSLVFIILMGAAMLTAAFRAFGGEDLVREFLTSLPGGFWAQFIVVMLVIFLLGFFLDFIEIAVVVVPIVAPILLLDPGANITAVWLGVMIGLNIQTSFLTPPFGFALFYLRGVAPPSIKTVDMYKGVIPFIMLQLSALLIVALMPPLVNYLPQRQAMLSETAPPPTNPRLQMCIEEFVAREFSDNGVEIRNSIGAARSLDYSYLPDDLRSDITRSFSQAEKTFEQIEKIAAAQASVAAAVPGYEPLHTQVRALEKELRKIKRARKDYEQRLERLPDGAPGEAERKQFIALLARLEEEEKNLRAEIPQQWDGDHAKFAELQKSELKARRSYRRSADNAFEPVKELLGQLNAREAYVAAKGELAKLEASIRTDKADVSQQTIKEAQELFRTIPGTSGIQKELRQARRAIRKGGDKDKSLAALAKATAAYNDGLEWRERAAGELKPALERYAATISGTIGLRQQARLPRRQALEVAACRSHHRPLGLAF